MLSESPGVDLHLTLSKVRTHGPIIRSHPNPLHAPVRLLEFSSARLLDLDAGRLPHQRAIGRQREADLGTGHRAA